MAKLTFDPKWHRYYVDGKPVPSVSKILGQLDKPALVSWSARITAEYIVSRIPDILSGDLILTPDDVKQLSKDAKNEYMEISKKACAIGTDTHGAIEEYLKTGKKPKGLPKEIQTPFDAFLIFAKEMKLEKAIESEKMFHSSYGYCGTLDIVAEIVDPKYSPNKQKYILDIKTSKGFYKEMPKQLAAYLYGYTETEKLNPADYGIGIIRLDKESGLPYWKNYSKIKEVSFKQFICLLEHLELEEEVKQKGE